MELFIELLVSSKWVGKLVWKSLELVWKLGIWIINLVSLSSKSITELREKYKEAALPLFLGFGTILLIKWLIWEGVRYYYTN